MRCADFIAYLDAYIFMQHKYYCVVRLSQHAIPLQSNLFRTRTDMDILLVISDCCICFLPTTFDKTRLVRERKTCDRRHVQGFDIRGGIDRLPTQNVD